MQRIIVHSDLNNFYAGVECKLNSKLVGKPIAVCGNKEDRHGIVLAKSEEAKEFGVQTGDTIWQAKEKCPDIIIVNPNFPKYIEYSQIVRNIYARFTEFVESYGIDECWLDISTSTLLFPQFDGEKFIEVNGEKHYSMDYLIHLGNHIRNTVKNETGLTVSCGVSFNKVFAKLGSDINKPDGTFVIPQYNFMNIIGCLGVEDLLYVGKATQKTLKLMGIRTINQLARADDDRIIKTFGKFGVTLLKNARGEECEPVKRIDSKTVMKSIGNSCTYPKDVEDLRTIKRNLYIIAESIATRVRELDQGLVDTVHLYVRDYALKDYNFQKKVRHTALCSEIATHAYTLFTNNFKLPFKIRSLGISVSGFDNGHSQLTFDEAYGKYQKQEALERCVDEIRKKYGYDKLQRGIIAENKSDMSIDIKSTHLIKPARIEYPATPKNNDDDPKDDT